MIEQEVTKFINSLQSSVTGVNFKPLYQEIGEIILSSIAANFRVGGRYSIGPDGEPTGGNWKWPISGRAEKQSGQTLVDTRQLASSITADVTEFGLTIGTNKVYAAIHQYGGTASETTLPPRPFLVIQEEDFEEIQDAASDFYTRILSR